MHLGQIVLCTNLKPFLIHCTVKNCWNSTFPYIFALFFRLFPYLECDKCEKVNYTSCPLLYHRYLCRMLNESHIYLVYCHYVSVIWSYKEEKLKRNWKQKYFCHTVVIRVFQPRPRRFTTFSYYLHTLSLWPSVSTTILRFPSSGILYKLCHNSTESTK